jgi:hypothetical protein
VLDEELQRLPTRYRLPLVLCYLAGKSRDEAARQLGTTLATLKRRLEQGRERLRSRLERRGVSLPAALAAVGLTTAAVPRAVATATAQVARLAASGKMAGLSSPAIHLAAESLRSATAGKWKILSIAILFVSLLGTGWLGHSTPADDQKAANPSPKKDDTAKSARVSFTSRAME